MCVSAASAQVADDQDAPLTRHPVIGEKAANVVTNADILALPEVERQAWIHGAITMTAQTAAAHNPETARCVMSWYFDYPETHIRIARTMEAYPEERASSSMFALAKMACANL